MQFRPHLAGVGGAWPPWISQLLAGRGPSLTQCPSPGGYHWAERKPDQSFMQELRAKLPVRWGTGKRALQLEGTAGAKALKWD